MNTQRKMPKRMTQEQEKFHDSFSHFRSISTYVFEAVEVRVETEAFVLVPGELAVGAHRPAVKHLLVRLPREAQHRAAAGQALPDGTRATVDQVISAANARETFLICCKKLENVWMKRCAGQTREMSSATETHTILISTCRDRPSLG